MSTSKKISSYLTRKEYALSVVQKICDTYGVPRHLVRHYVYTMAPGPLEGEYQLWLRDIPFYSGRKHWESLRLLGIPTEQKLKHGVRIDVDGILLRVVYRV